MNHPIQISQTNINNEVVQTVNARELHTYRKDLQALIERIEVAEQEFGVPVKDLRHLESLERSPK